MFTSWRDFQREVRMRLEHDGKPYLHPVFHDLYDVARRLREVDPTLFVVRNTLRGRFEVHCLEHRPSSFAWQVPWAVLDGRVIEKAQYNRVGRVSTSEWVRSIEAHNEKVNRRNERDFENFTQSFARDTRPLWKRLAENRG
jgi:hypothetical protein